MSSSSEWRRKRKKWNEIIPTSTWIEFGYMLHWCLSRCNLNACSMHSQKNPFNTWMFFSANIRYAHIKICTYIRMDVNVYLNRKIEIKLMIAAPASMQHLLYHFVAKTIDTIDWHTINLRHEHLFCARMAHSPNKSTIFIWTPSLKLKATSKHHNDDDDYYDEYI